MLCCVFTIQPTYIFYLAIFLHFFFFPFLRTHKPLHSYLSELYFACGHIRSFMFSCLLMFFFSNLWKAQKFQVCLPSPPPPPLQQHMLEALNKTISIKNWFYFTLLAARVICRLNCAHMARILSNASSVFFLAGSFSSAIYMLHYNKKNAAVFFFLQKHIAAYFWISF